MNTERWDIAIAGGGLAGGLIALALRQRRPELKVALVEQGETLGGNHRWSWFASDLDREGTMLLDTVRKLEWDDGYEVRFPAYRRHLRTKYRSMHSADFDAALQRDLASEGLFLRRAVKSVDGGGIELADGERIDARAAIDCRGFVPSAHLAGGWQLFMGRHVRLPRPHGLARPLIMDANVAQHGAYRFVYVLPLGAYELFVEDTYYADSPVLDRPALSRRLDEYCTAQGWAGDILGSETGVLPVLTGGNHAAYRADTEVPGVALAGTRGLFGHPLTGYGLPQAMRVAQLVAENADLPGDQLAALLAAHSRTHWRSTKFYRRLGRMLFQAARPEERYRIFERFYRLPAPLIERFYAARSNRLDHMRILCGKPPVPVGKAVAALTGAGAPLAQRRAA
jgi:lycopene beta-cyclase